MDDCGEEYLLVNHENEPLKIDNFNCPFSGEEIPGEEGERTISCNSGGACFDIRYSLGEISVLTYETFSDEEKIFLGDKLGGKLKKLEDWE